MASYQFLCLLFTTLLLSVVSPSYSTSYYTFAEPAGPKFASVPGYPPKIATNSKKVELSLYYETLCPYSRDFIVGPLADAFHSDLMTITNLRLVPWGNAILQNSTIICQHGEDECYLNIIHACAIHTWPDVKTHFNFIQCSENRSKQISPKLGAEATWKDCAEQLGLPAQPIMECYENEQGKELVLQYGNETAQLNPPHEYVPWVTVDKKPLEDHYENFVKFVCDAYKGQPPPSCSSHPSYLTEKPKVHLSGCGRSDNGGGDMQPRRMGPPAA